MVIDAFAIDAAGSATEARRRRTNQRTAKARDRYPTAGLRARLPHAAHLDFECCAAAAARKAAGAFGQRERLRDVDQRRVDAAAVRSVAVTEARLLVDLGGVDAVGVAVRDVRRTVIDLGRETGDVARLASKVARPLRHARAPRADAARTPAQVVVPAVVGRVGRADLIATRPRRLVALAREPAAAGEIAPNHVAHGGGRRRDAVPTHILQQAERNRGEPRAIVERRRH